MARLRPSTVPEWATPFDPTLELDWAEPVYNRRLLREHLDQSHEGASRSIPVVDRQVARLMRLLPAPPADVLDAACGPGLYTVRLARRGHRVVGVDVGDAVLRHARRLIREARLTRSARVLRCDLRELDMPGRFDAVLFIYFGVELFRAVDQVRVLRRLGQALRPGGRLITEMRVRPDQPPGRVTSWDVVPWSLLSDRPHLLLTDTAWDDRSRIYTLRELAVFDDGTVTGQQTTGLLTPLAAVPHLFARAGLRVVAAYDGWTRHRATGLSETLLVVAEPAAASGYHGASARGTRRSADRWGREHAADARPHPQRRRARAQS